MLVTRFEIHVSWRIVWREPGGLLKEGVEGGARRQRPQAKHTQTHAARRRAPPAGKHQAKALSDERGRMLVEPAWLLLAPRTGGRQVPTSHTWAGHSQAAVLA